MIPFQSQIITGIAVAVLAIPAGWTARGWKEDAARLDAEREAHANYTRIATAYGIALTDAQDGRAKDQQQAAVDRQAFNRRLHDEKQKGTRLVVCGDGLDFARPDDSGLRVRFDPAFVGLWNDAIKIGLPTTLRTD